MKRDIDSIKKEAQILFVFEGRSQKEIASEINISEKTVGQWVKKHNWDNNKKTEGEKSNSIKAFLTDFKIPDKIVIESIETKKFFANYLIIVKGYQQKEAGKILSVSEKTMSLWSKKYDWKKKRELQKDIKINEKSLIDGFFRYVEKFNMPLYKPLKFSWSDYLLRLELQIDTMLNGMENKRIP
jgi:transposase